MNIISASAVLADVGLTQPIFNVLTPSVDNYSALLFQPEGNIDVLYEKGIPVGVKNKNVKLMSSQFIFFIRNAVELKVDLAITPEYSMPWSVLTDAVKGGLLPKQGGLWAFGCESITYNELLKLKKDLEGVCQLVFEPLKPDHNRFLDPLAYVFDARKKKEDELRPVMLVQFKTCPMGDNDHFEINGLQRGTNVYEFQNNNNSVKLLSLICSDVFDFEAEAHGANVYDRRLLIHIQLQKDPRHTQYLRYRESILKYSGDQTEVLCLNWSRDVIEWTDGKQSGWNNIAGSAWYTKSREIDLRDPNLCSNHKHGLYYTWLRDLRTHGLFFNYLPAIHLLTATKVYHHGVEGPRSTRVGPKLDKSWIWNNKAAKWETPKGLPDGFHDIVSDCDGAKDQIADIVEQNPFAAERLLALSAGAIGLDDSWYGPVKLDSCIVDLNEHIKRITFAQDTKQEMKDFRTRRLKRCGRLLQILKTPNDLPVALQDLKDGFHFTWSPDFPHQNIISHTGKRATAIYAGEEVNVDQLDTISKIIAELLHRKNHDRQRLVVWYRSADGTITHFDLKRYLDFYRDDKASEVDITRAE